MLRRVEVTYFCVLTTLLACTAPVFSQRAPVTGAVQPYAAVDSAVARFSRQGYSPDSLVPFATREFKSDTHRVRAFFTWIALNIAYDKSLLDQYTFTSALIGNFRPGGRSQHADTVLAHRKAVCEGYCNLMNRFCAQAGITSVLVPGITRIPEGDVQERVLHTWTAVRVNGKWELLDITWSGGYVDLRDRYVRHFSGKFFLTPPAEFVVTHWPLAAMWQLLPHPVDKKSFYRVPQPDVGPEFNFNDSIADYLRLPEVEREYAELLLYHRNDTVNPMYREGLDQLLYNRAATVFNKAMLYFDDYTDYALSLKGKQIGLKEIRRCMRLLEVPREFLLEGMGLADGKRFFHAGVKEQYDQMVLRSSKILAEVNDFLAQYRKMEDSLK